jgi:hypothetical protein
MADGGKALDGEGTGLVFVFGDASVPPEVGPPVASPDLAAALAPPRP